MELARAQLATQSPACDTPADAPNAAGADSSNSGDGADGASPSAPNESGSEDAAETENKAAAYEEDAEADASDASIIDEELLPTPAMSGNSDANGMTGATVPAVALPPDWPDERGFIPPGPSPVRPQCIANDGPIMTHTRIYHGNDSEFTEALASYYEFRDDARFGGWQTYLQRSDDFIRFCCHMHIAEMLSARGGAGETRVVWRWPESR
jgi:hypothetical protein